MSQPPPEAVRKSLKVFGVAVTDFQDKSAELLQRYRTAGTADEREAVRRQGAELVAGLHQALRRVQSQVLELQSEFLMELVAKEDDPTAPTR